MARGLQVRMLQKLRGAGAIGRVAGGHGAEEGQQHKAHAVVELVLRQRRFAKGGVLQDSERG
jgi:hypothetical protein